MLGSVICCLVDRELGAVFPILGMYDESGGLFSRLMEVDFAVGPFAGRLFLVEKVKPVAVVGRINRENHLSVLVPLEKKPFSDPHLDISVQIEGAGIKASTSFLNPFAGAFQ